MLKLLASTIVRNLNISKKGQNEFKCLKSIWKFVRGVGAICGIVLTVILIWNQITKPEPPDIRIAFALTKTSVLQFALEESSTDGDGTAPLPMGLQITNIGGATAKNCILRLIHPTTCKINSNTIQLEQKEIYGSTLTTMTTINLPNIHPGQTVYFDKDLEAAANNQKDVLVDIAPYNPSSSPDFNGSPPVFGPITNKQVDEGITLTFEVHPKPTPAYPVTYEIEAQLSAENLREEYTKLYIIVGTLQTLKTGDIIVIKDGRLLRLQ